MRRNHFVLVGKTGRRFARPASTGMTKSVLKCTSALGEAPSEALTQVLLPRRKLGRTWWRAYHWASKALTAKLGLRPCFSTSAYLGKRQNKILYEPIRSVGGTSGSCLPVYGPRILSILQNARELDHKFG